MMRGIVEFVDRTPEVLPRIVAASDLMMGLMAAGIEIQIKTAGKTPFLHGNLRSSARHRRLGMGTYIVEDTASYAAAQEAGTTRGHAMVNYTTPGTGKGYFREAIKTVLERQIEYAETAKKATGL